MRSLFCLLFTILSATKLPNMQHPQCTEFLPKSTNFIMKNDLGRTVAVYEQSPGVYHYTTSDSSFYRNCTGFKGDVWSYTTDGRVCVTSPVKTVCVRASVDTDTNWYTPVLVESSAPVRANEYESFDVVCDSNNNCVFQAIGILVPWFGNMGDKRHLVLNRHESEVYRIRLRPSNGHKAQRFHVTPQ